MGRESSATSPREQADGLRRTAWGVWGLFTVVLAVKLAAAPQIHSVFPKFVAGGAHWLAGEPLYADREGLGAFRYSPVFAAAMVPFAWAGLRPGSVVWVLMNVAAYVGGLRRLARDVLPGEWPPDRIALFLLAAMPGAIRGFWNAQSNPLVAGCLMLAASSLMRGGFWTAAVLLSAAVHLKLAPLAVALLFVALYPRRLAGPFALSLLGVGLLPFLTQSPAYVLGEYQAWFAYLRESAGRRWPSFRDARTLWEQSGIGIHAGVYLVVQATGGLGALAYAMLQRHQRPESPRDGLSRALGVGLVYLMLLGPAVEAATYVLIAPIAAWALLAERAHPAGRALAASAYLLTVVFTFGAAERALAGLGTLPRVGLPLGTILLGAWLLLPRRTPP